MITAITNLKAWQKVIGEQPYCDIFYHPKYANVFARAEVNNDFKEAFSGEPMLLVYGDLNGQVINPVFKREIPGTDLYDIISPYGYSGALPCSSPSLPDYLAQMHSFCLKNDIVSEFARLHPFFYHVLPESIKKSEVVWVNLEENLDVIHRSFSKNCRNAITNAKRSGVTIEIVEGMEPLDMLFFTELYTKTMQRNNASKRYFFSFDFFDKLRAAFLPKNMVVVDAWYKGANIASAIFLHYKDLIHYYLAGSNDVFKVNANNLLLAEAIAWAKERGFKKMNLGGGYKENDSLFKFKQGFSPLKEDFYIYQKVHMQEQYDDLSKGKSTDFFPAYRG